jgi:hypothetical protein
MKINFPKQKTHTHPQKTFEIQVMSPHSGRTILDFCSPNELSRMRAVNQVMRMFVDTQDDVWKKFLLCTSLKPQYSYQFEFSHFTRNQIVAYKKIMPPSKARGLKQNQKIKKAIREHNIFEQDLWRVDVLKVIHVDYKHVIPRLDRGIHKKNIEKWIPAGVYPREIWGGNDKTSTAPRRNK